MKDYFKQLAKILGGSFFMGMGAYSMGCAYVVLYEKIMGQPITTNPEVKK